MTSSKFDSCQHFLGPYHQEEIFLVQTYQDFLIGKDSISLISCRVSEQGALRVRSATCLPSWLVIHMACRMYEMQLNGPHIFSGLCSTPYMDNTVPNIR